MNSSWFEEQVLGGNIIEPVHESRAGHRAVLGDHVAGSSRGRSTRIADGVPLGVDAITHENTAPLLEAAGDDPLDGQRIGTTGDPDRPGVLLTGAVDAVEDIDTGDAGAVLDGIVEREAARDDDRCDESSGDEAENRAAAHATEGTDRLRIPRWAKVLAGVALVLAVATAAFATLKPVKVLPRIRLAPGYVLRTSAGTSLNSETGRGSVTVYSFVPSRCDEVCEQTEATVREIRERAAEEVDLGATPLRFVTVVLDAGATDAELADAAAHAGGGDDWQFVSGTPEQLRNVVTAGFKRAVDEFDGAQDDFYSGYVIVDGWGIVRGDYRYPTLRDDADKLVDHLGVLGSELRHPGGIASFAYGAAHVFACYP